MCADLPGGWQNPHPCQVCVMVQCPLLCACTICSMSSRAVCDGHWASCGEQMESWYLIKSRSCWKWDCPLCPACCTPAFPSAPLLGGCIHHGSAGIYLSSSVHLTAFLSTYFRMWHRHCVFNAGLNLFAPGNFLSCNGALCWKLLADATCTKQHQHPLCFISWSTVSVCPS